MVRKVKNSTTEYSQVDEGGTADAAEIKHAIALAAEAASKAFGWDTDNNDVTTKSTQQSSSSSSSTKPTEGNELTHLIPGYTAPLRLEAKSLQGITGNSLSELRSRAGQSESSTNNPSVSALKRTVEEFDPAVAAKKVKTPSSIAIQKELGRSGGGIPTTFSSSFKKTARKQRDNSAGRGWFGMTPTPMSDQLKSDLAIIRNRNYLDPKKFYKSADSFKGKVLQVGTVIEGSSEFYSSRMTNKERKQNLTEEIMSDVTVANYAKRKYYDMQSEKQRQRGSKKGKGKKRR
mmetsp:Transcript_18475/g.28985  ORF Transcript_18475/g.28985 Transcript_18475/m.28985 type:complete len:289 (+) Transcript_18475:42-908(+)